MTEDAKKPLGRILLKQHAISQPELDRALATPSTTPLATRLTESGALSEIAALKALSEQSGVPGIDLGQVIIRLADLEILPREVAQRHKLLPVLVREDRVFVAMAEPTEKKVIDELEFVTGKRVYPYVALSGSLLRLIVTAYEMRDRGETFYVGPACPPEVQRKAGVVPAEKPKEPEPLKLPPSLLVDEPQAPVAPPRPAGPPPQAPPARPNAAPPRAGTMAPAEQSMRPSQLMKKVDPAASSPVIVDDAMGKMTVADDVGLQGFGDADRDLSVVGRLPTDPRASSTQRTLLVVDDEADIRRLLRRVFEDRGYRVVEADRGLLALRIVKENPPDAIVLDAMLPEVHGFEIAKRIKGTARYGHIPIVMVSAVYRGWRIAADLKAAYGVDAYLEKPFRVPDVVAAVEGALTSKSQQMSAVEATPAQASEQAERELAAGIAAYKAGDLQGALEHLKRGSALDPLAYRLHYHLGLLYGKVGQIYDAIQELETALSINARHFSALKNLAVLYQQAGFRNKAIEAWERALVVAPDEPTRMMVREHLLGLL